MYHFPSNNLTEKQLKHNTTLYIYQENKTKQTLQSKEKNKKALYLKNKPGTNMF